jgi:hypothetical protein
MRIVAAALVASLLAGCASGGAVGSASKAKSGSAAVERFAYKEASDKQVRATVVRALTYEDEGFLPKDRNWIQIELTVANIGKRPVQFADVKTRVTDGTVIASAQAAQELAKPPSMAGTAAKSVGLGAAGHMAGMLLFPPLALAASAASLFTMFGGTESWGKRLEKIQRSALSPQTLAPGTSASGTVYVPAVKGQNALLLFYSVDGRSDVLTITRA